MPPTSTRHLDSICRIYKNASGKVIAIDSLFLTVDKLTIPTSKTTQKFHMSIDDVDRHRTLLHLETGGSRVVATIQQIGGYSSVEENSGNFLVIQYDKPSVDQNDILISLEPYVSKIGDTV